MLQYLGDVRPDMFKILINNSVSRQVTAAKIYAII
jgi:hypothetical protein